MAVTLRLDGDVTITDAAGIVIRKFPLDLTDTLTDEVSHRKTYTVAQVDTAIDMGGMASASVVLIVNHSPLESITIKHNGGATDIPVGGYLLLTGSAITALTFSWTLSGVGVTLDLEAFLWS